MPAPCLQCKGCMRYKGQVGQFDKNLTISLGPRAQRFSPARRPCKTARAPEAEGTARGRLARPRDICNRFAQIIPARGTALVNIGARACNIFLLFIKAVAVNAGVIACGHGGGKLFGHKLSVHKHKHFAGKQPALLKIALRHARARVAKYICGKPSFTRPSFKSRSISSYVSIVGIHIHTGIHHIHLPRANILHLHRAVRRGEHRQRSKAFHRALQRGAGAQRRISSSVWRCFSRRAASMRQGRGFPADA